MELLTAFLIVAMQSFQDIFVNFFNGILVALPGIIGAIIIIIIGIIVGWAVGKLIESILHRTIEKTFDKSDVGKTFKASGFNISTFIGGIVEAFIIIVSIAIAIPLLSIGGVAGDFLIAIAAYLPRLLGGIIVIVLGIVLVDILAGWIGQTIKPMFPTKPEFADLLKNFLFIGLVAVILSVGFELLLFGFGDIIFSVILGFLIVGVGISLTDGLIKSIVAENEEFKSVAGFAKFALYAIFLIIGSGAIFATLPGVTAIIANIAWAFAIALAILLIPVVYVIIKKTLAYKE
jgi:hypothetical protein